MLRSREKWTLDHPRFCAFELEYMLGADGLAELRTMARERPETASDQSSDAALG